MYENEIYSGDGAGSNTSGAYSGSSNTGSLGNSSTNVGSTGSNTANSSYYNRGYGSNSSYGNESHSGSSYSNDSNSGNSYANDSHSGNSSYSNDSHNGNSSYSNDNYSGYRSSSENDSVGSNNYSTYETGRSTPPQREKPRKTKRKGGYFRKAMASVSLGLCFGLFAGVGFYAVEQSTGLLPSSTADGTVLSQSTNTSTGVVDETQSGIKLTDTSSIRVVSSDVQDVAKEVMPAMVSIVNNYTASTTFYGQTYSQEAAASGSGIIVAESDTELLIVTNHHVVADATTLEITFADGSTAEAQIKGMDSDMDLAVIAIPLDTLSEETKNNIAIATMGDSDSLELGEPVVAIGNALGYGQSVTSGIISALNREVTLEDGSTGTFLQTDAAINPGNSGGALLNVSGEVIGINSNKIGGTTVEGMGYAIPISAAKPIIAELMLKETRIKVEADQIGYIGIQLQTITSDISQMYNMPEGVYVIGVEGTPAQEAGILKGDIITEFEGESITSYEDLQEVLQYYAAGSTANLTVQRSVNGEYQELELTITLGSKSASQS